MSTLYSIPGIYNVLDYSVGPGQTAVNNTANMATVISHAVSDTNGAMILFPTVDGSGFSGPYQFSTTSGTIMAIPGVGGTTQPLLICGTGGGTTLESLTANATFFSVSSDAVTFQDLTIVYASEPESSPTGTAFSFSGGQGYNLFRVSIIDFSTGVEFYNLTQAYMVECTVTYTTNYPTATLAAVYVDQGAEVWIDKCLLSFTGSANIESGQIGVKVGQSSWTRITQTEVQNFYTGIALGIGSGQSAGTMITNTHVTTPSGGIGLSIVQNVYDVKVIGCRFESVTAGTAQNIVINPTSNAGGDTLMFDSCVSTGSIDYGIQIVAGQSIQILGGTYSGNTTAGIAITGSAAEVQINGVSCEGVGDAGASGPQIYGIYITAGSDIQILNANCSGNGTSTNNGSGIYIDGTVSRVQISTAICNGATPTSYQSYGISIQSASDIVIDQCTASANLLYGISLVKITNVTVTSCDLYGNSTAGLLLSGGTGLTGSKFVYIRDCNITGYSTSSTILFTNILSNIAVTNCAGYNDRAYPVRMTPPGSGTFSGVTYGYYGPTAFYAVGTGLSVTIDGTATGLGQGGYTLGIGESASISGTPTNFYMFGR